MAMSQAAHRRLSGWQKASALVPLALLSGAWTASMAVGGTPASASSAQHRHALPDGTHVPSQAIKAPASVTVPGEIAPGVPRGAAQDVIDSASTDGIPAVALAAYERAAQVIDAADPSCHLKWPLIAAIGRVESDHGRFGGSTLGSNGVAHPGIYGIPLDGRNGTARVPDTDGGQYDHDPVWDRAVGPMQFIPSTWSVVGVDADGDGVANPQDINDASLATAVYLCSGDENLSTAKGQQDAVYRYNHSQAYVDLVLAIMRAYQAGDFAAVPNGTYAPTTLRYYSGSKITAGTRGGHSAHHSTHAHPARSGSSGTSGGSFPSTGSGGSGGSGGSSGSGGSGSSTSPGTGSGGGGPISAPTSPPTKVTKPAQDLLTTTTEAANFCSTQVDSLINGLPSSFQTKVINACAAKVKGKTKDEAAKAIPDTLDALLKWLGLSPPSLIGQGGPSLP
jgi:hypothetical protein